MFDGNKQFFDFMKEYNLEHSTIYFKYNGFPAKYYAKRLKSKVTNKPFNMHYPFNDWRDEVFQV